jgi:hypothetical protein
MLFLNTVCLIMASTNSKCEMWATDGLCNSDKDMEVFMAKECPYACDVC